MKLAIGALLLGIAFCGSTAYAIDFDLDVAVAQRENLSKPDFWPAEEQEIALSARVRPLQAWPLWATVTHALHASHGDQLHQDVSIAASSGTSVRAGVRGEWAFHERGMAFADFSIIPQGQWSLETSQALQGEDLARTGQAHFKGVQGGVGVGWELTPFFMTSFSYHRNQESLHLTRDGDPTDHDFAVTAQSLAVSGGVRW